MNKVKISKSFKTNFNVETHNIEVDEKNPVKCSETYHNFMRASFGQHTILVQCSKYNCFIQMDGIRAKKCIEVFGIKGAGE